MAAMRRRPRGRAPLAAAAAVGLAGALAAPSCGSRSTLEGVTFVLAAGGGSDAGPDDAGPPDGAPVDAPLPPIETGSLPDVVLTNCSTPSTQYIYLVTYENHLWSFYPATGAFTSIGALACATQSSPFSMAVDRQGVAYVLYSNGQLFRVSTRTAQCEATPYVAPSSSFMNFGMGFVGDPNGATDTLYVASVGANNVLATVSLETFQPTVVGPLSLPMAELTGTGDGRLYTFYSTGGSTAVAQLDPQTAAVLADSPLTNLPTGDGWAFGFWGGDFYLFTAQGGLGSPSLVTRFRPSDGSQTTVTTLPETIVGAGVSTCAPQM
jgi:hypothetical protein